MEHEATIKLWLLHYQGWKDTCKYTYIKFNYEKEDEHILVAKSLLEDLAYNQKNLDHPDEFKFLTYNPKMMVDQQLMQLRREEGKYKSL